MEKTTIPWSTIRAEFIAGTGPWSLRAFAEQHDVPYSTLRRHAKREGWKESRRLSDMRGRLRLDTRQRTEAMRTAKARLQRFLGLADGPGASLRSLYESAELAVCALHEVAYSTIWLARDTAELASLEAGRKPGNGLRPEWRSGYAILNARRAKREAQQAARAA